MSFVVPSDTQQLRQCMCQSTVKPCDWLHWLTSLPPSLLPLSPGALLIENPGCFHQGARFRSMLAMGPCCLFCSSYTNRTVPWLFDLRPNRLRARGVSRHWCKYAPGSLGPDLARNLSSCWVLGVSVEKEQVSLVNSVETKGYQVYILSVR